MADRSYLPGVRPLVESIERNGGLADFELTVVCIGGLDPADAPTIETQTGRVEFLDRADLGEFKYNTDILKRDYKYINQNKFLVFKLPYEGPVCYVDVDMLCLNDISAIESFEPFAACVNIGGDPPYTINERPMFNSGLFVFEPNEETFEEIQQYVTAYDQMTKFGDQRLFNEFMYEEHPDDVSHLGFNWNVTITVKHHRPKLWDYLTEEGIKFLHYTVVKPWKPPDRSRGLHRYYVDVRRQYRYRKELDLWNEYTSG